MEKIDFCFKIKNGIKIIEPNKTISDSFLKLAKTTLKRAELMFKENDLLWTTVMLYYAEYYALYSFLSKIGIKCENHSCSILLTKYLLGKESTKIIEEQKNRRVSSQYYLRIFEERKIKEMFTSSKYFVAEFEEKIMTLTPSIIEQLRKKVKNLKNKPY